jgi:hypothetical protein
MLSVVVFSLVTYPVGTSVVTALLDPLSVDKFVVVFVVLLVTVFLLAQPAAETTAATINSTAMILKIFFINGTSKILFPF